MSLLQRLTEPALKRFYTFVLKTLAGRFLKDDIMLENLEVHLRAGRVDLSNLNLDPEALAPYLPNGALRVSSARVGHLRAEISYRRLLSESLAFFLTDVEVELVPAGCDDSSGAGGAGAAEARGEEGLSHGSTHGPEREGLAEAVQVAGDPTDLLEQGGGGEAAEGMPFLAQWIQQISSRMKVMVNNLHVRVLGDAGGTGGVLGLRASSVSYCDATPDYVSSTPAGGLAGWARNGPAGPATQRANGLRGPPPGLVVHKRVTFGPSSLEYGGGRAGLGAGTKFARTVGAGCVVIKHNQQPHPSLGDPVLDVDVSVRHLNVTLSPDTCVGLQTLVAACSPPDDALPAAAGLGELVQSSLFLEPFWYFDETHDAGSEADEDVNFCTLEKLLRQYAEARRRLAQEMNLSHSVYSAPSSLEDSDCFYDCIPDEEAAGGHGPGGGGGGGGGTRFRTRIAAASVVLLPEQQQQHADSRNGEPGDAGPQGRGASPGGQGHFAATLRHVSHTVHLAADSSRVDAEVGGMILDLVGAPPPGVSAERTGRTPPEEPRRSIVHFHGDQDSDTAGPCVRVTSDTSAGASSMEVACRSVGVTVDEHVLSLASALVSAAQLPSPPAPGPPPVPVPAAATCISVEVAIPKLVLYIGTDPSVCSSPAVAALLESTRSGTSQVHWEHNGWPGVGVPGAPALVLRLELVSTVLRPCQTQAPVAALQCKNASGFLLLPCEGCGRETAHHVALHFLEADVGGEDGCSAGVVVEYGSGDTLVQGMPLGGTSAAPPGVKLESLHTWEPNEGSGGGLEDMGASAGQGSCGTAASQERRRTLSCLMPRLAVELSRLEYVVLVDMLARIPAGPPPHRQEPADPVVSKGEPLNAVLHAHAATVVLHEPLQFAEDPGPHSYLLNLTSAHILFGGATSAGDEPAVTMTARDLCLHEARSTPAFQAAGPLGPVLFVPDQGSEPARPRQAELEALGFAPVLYRTKWLRASNVAETCLEVQLLFSRTLDQVGGAPGGGVPGERERHLGVTATFHINLFDVSLRYHVASNWLPRLLSLVVGDQPAGVGPLGPGRLADSHDPVGGEVGAAAAAGAGAAAANADNLTKVFVTVYRGLVDYHPRVACRRTSGRLEGRAVFSLGVLRVSSNLVPGAVMQGFKVVVRDIAVHMSDHFQGYELEDAGLCGGALEPLRDAANNDTYGSHLSVQETLEAWSFVQVATLNFLDAFLRNRTQVATPADTYLGIELWMGVLRVYTCSDSLATCQDVLSHWWTSFSECRTIPPPQSASHDTPNPPQPRAAEAWEVAGAGGTRDGGRVGGHVQSLLDDVEEDAFLPPPCDTNTNHHQVPLPAATATKASQQQSSTLDRTFSRGGAGQTPPSGGEDRLPSASPSSLVIEDYYCVAVKLPTPSSPPPARAGREQEGEQLHREPPPFLTGPGLSDSPDPGDQGHARWLESPLPGTGPGGVFGALSMEVAEDSSDSDDGEDDNTELGHGERTHGNTGLWLNAGVPAFRLPGPIEIELEGKQRAGGEESQEAAHAGGGVGDLWRLGSEEGSEDEEDQAAGAVEDSDQESGGMLDLNGPGRQLAVGWCGPPPAYTPDSSERLASSEVTEASTAITGAGGGWQGQLIHSGKGEQEAHWFGSDAEPAESPGQDAAGDSGSAPVPLRIYPHYIPIPAAGDATALYPLGGISALVEPWLGAAGREPQGTDPTGSAQRLQLQVVVHDLSVCWRLFKGCDWRRDPSGTPGHKPSNLQGHGLQHGDRHGRARADPPPPPAPAGGLGRGQIKVDRAPGPTLATADFAPPGARGRKAELLDALLEDYAYRDAHVAGSGGAGRSGSRQPKVKVLNVPPTANARGHAGRDTSCMLELVLDHATVHLDTYNPLAGHDLLSNLSFNIKDLHVSDTLTSSRPRKTLQHWKDDSLHPREYHQKMFTLRMTARSPSQHCCPGEVPLSDEYMLKLRLLPLHVTFGQHTIDFLRSFAGGGGGGPPHVGPAKQSAGRPGSHAEGLSQTGEAVMAAASSFFFACCDMGNLQVKIDYQPRSIRVKTLQEGDFLELLNLFPLEGVQLTLTKLLLTGASGWGGLFQHLLQSWVQDITSKQLHKFVAGTTAIRPLVSMGQGMADLLLLPIKQYQRDRRLLRGLRNGTTAFFKAVTVETLHTSHRLVSYVARALDDIVTPGNAPGSSRTMLQYYHQQPRGVLDSLEQAYDSLRREVLVAAQTIVAIPYEEQEEHVGPHGSYMRSIVRALPVAVLRPVVGATEALSCTLLGFRNHMAPAMRKQEEDMWR